MRHLAAFIFVALVVLVSPAAAQLTGEWIVVDSRHEGRTGSSPSAIAAAARGHYVVITWEDPLVGPFTIRRTTDAGSSWQVVRADSGRYWRLFAIEHPSPDLILAVGDTSVGVTAEWDSPVVRHPFILRSTDAGASWSRHDLPAGWTIESIAMASASSGIVVATRIVAEKTYAHLILTTSDGGATWTERSIPSSPQLLGRPAARGDRSFVVPAFDAATLAATLYRTSDDGVTWSEAPFFGAIRSIDFVDDDLGIAVGGRRTGLGDTETDIILRTTDGGATWTTILDAPVDFRFGLWDVSMADASNAIAVGGYAKIHRTTDGGLTWRQEWPPSFATAEYTGFRQVAYPVADDAMATTGNSSFVMRYTGRQRLAAPRITAPSVGLAELPFELTVEWTPVAGATWYDLQVGDTTYEFNRVDHKLFDEPWIDAPGLTTTSHLVELLPRTRYYFRVRARSATDTSDWSVRLSTITRDAAQTLVAPAFTLPAMGDTAVALPVRFAWMPIPNATGYDLRVFSEFGDEVVALDGHPAAEYVAPGLEPASPYFARVRARSATEVSAWSNIGQGTLQFRTATTSSVGPEPAATSTIVRIAPNPARDGRVVATIEGTLPGAIRVTIEGLRGELLGVVTERVVGAGITTLPIDLTGYPQGLLLVVVDRDGRRVVAPVVNVR